MSDICNLSRGIAEESRAEGIAQGIERGIAQGMERGITVGENRLSRLINLLVKNNDLEKITAATSNPAEREKLYWEYGII